MGKAKTPIKILTMDKLLKKILREITPTRGEHIKERQIFNKVVKKLEKFDVKPILVGSIAKKTDLSGDKDIDIFIMFPKDTSREELEEKGLKMGKKVFKELGVKYEIDYAEHPYVMGNYKGYLVEVVPCYRTKELQSAVDRTPHHTRYIQKKLRRNEKLRGDIRLLKQFMKGTGVYGAEAKVQGFSGYLTELLCINYGSFEDTLKAASEWKFKGILDPEDIWENKKVLKHFFPEASLIVIDPIDENRNAAAAVSAQSMARFIHTARKFLENPGREFFFPPGKKAPSARELSKRIKSRGTKIIAIRFMHDKINVNILYSQLRKTINSIVSHIHDYEFKVLKSGIWTDEKKLSVILLEFEVWTLPPIEYRMGPPIDKSHKEQDNFISKYKDFRPRIEKGRWVADVKREFTRVEQLMPKILSERRGFGKNLRELERIDFVSDEEILKVDGKEFLGFLGNFFVITLFH